MKPEPAPVDLHRIPDATLFPPPLPPPLLTITAMMMITMITPAEVINQWRSGHGLCAFLYARSAFA
jgi:hypothetical protein